MSSSLSRLLQFSGRCVPPCAGNLSLFTFLHFAFIFRPGTWPACEPLIAFEFPFGLIKCLKALVRLTRSRHCTASITLIACANKHFVLLLRCPAKVNSHSVATQQPAPPMDSSFTTLAHRLPTDRQFPLPAQQMHSSGPAILSILHLLSCLRCLAPLAPGQRIVICFGALAKASASTADLWLLSEGRKQPECAFGSSHHLVLPFTGWLWAVA